MSNVSPATTPDHKRANGQFFTVGNPFLLVPFKQWFQEANLAPGKPLLEPFAGAGDIPHLVVRSGIHRPWACFDLDPAPSAKPGPFITRRDTLASFPRGFGMAITNPPYLARNSAARRGLPFPITRYDDLYKHALATMLAHVPYVAAIVPESFITSGLFHDRLAATVSLACPMFDDTAHPVCLALFVPPDRLPLDGFILWDGDAHLGRYPQFANVLGPVHADQRIGWRFNDPAGPIGLRGVDDTRTASIGFVPGDTIPSSTIKHSSRAITRISGIPADLCPQDLICVANAALEDYRLRTHDTLMTSFKGLRIDGKYRRRLDFAAARNLLDHAAVRLRAPA